jgi:sulfite reductase (ferredoxin)
VRRIHGRARCGKNHAGMEAPRKAIRLDLRGVKCPLNWARAKVLLEQMARGEVLEVMLDDPRGARDIPGAAEAEGYVVLESTARDGIFHLRIER